jgi:uncharacterized protein DUF3617
MRSIVLGSLSAVCLVAWAHGCAQAQTPPIKPGLWQVRSEREVDGQKAKMPDMSEHLKNMPPEQRKQIEAMMKQRGVDMSGGSMNDMKICLSKDSLDRDQWQRNQGSCKTDYQTRVGNTWKWHTSCREPAAETDGEAHFTSSESYTVKTATTMTVQGETRTSRMTLNSKWLGADCGDIKPVTPPKQEGGGGGSPTR